MSDFILGVTGGIGSGKTTVTNAFSDWGITIVDADIVARDVVAPGSPCLKDIEKRFGPEILQADGTLNRGALRDIIFNSDEQKSWLNNLMHPVIRETMQSQLIAADSPYCILSAPLLLENKLEKYCDRVLVVDVPVEIQVSRTCNRDTVEASHVNAIINAQINRDERLNRADDIVDNSGNLESLMQQLPPLHEQYLEMARQHSRRKN